MALSAITVQAQDDFIVTISGDADAYQSTVVTLTGGSSVQSIYYSTENRNPSWNNGTLYTGPITLTESCAIFAIGYDESGNSTPVASKYFTITDSDDFLAQINGASPFYGSTTVTLSSKMNPESVYQYWYTTDGSDPLNTQSSSVNVFDMGDEPSFTITESCTIKAVAVFATHGPIATREFVKLADNLLEIGGASVFSKYTNVTINCLDDNYTGPIYYTIDGSDPRTSSTRQVYTTPFSVYETCTVKASIDPTTGDYMIEKDLERREIMPIISGTTPFTESTVVTIDLSWMEYERGYYIIYYSTDGSEPTLKNVYDGPFTITESCTVRTVVYGQDGLTFGSSAMDFVKDPSTAINDINVENARVYKTIENGQVIIVNGDARYNIMGQPVK